MSGLGNLGISRKLAMYTFQWNRVCGDWILDHKTVVFGTRAANNDFLIGGPFSDEDSRQFGDSLGELRQPSCRKFFLVQERYCFLDHLGADKEESVCKDCFQVGLLLSKILSKILRVSGRFSLFQS